MSFLIATAWAQEAAATTATAATQQGNIFMSMAPLLVIFVLFYLLIIRPQSKRIKEHQAAISALKAGDKVITGGGIFATVIKVTDAEVTVEIAPSVHIKVQKHTLTGLQEMPKAANDMPAKPKTDKAAKKKTK